VKAGWVDVELASACDVFTDGNWIETKDQADEGIRLVQTGNVGQGVFKDRGDKARYIDEATFRRLKCFEIVPGDCLISRLPDPVGRACRIPETGDKMITAVDCTVLRTNEKRLDPDFFIYYSQSAKYLKDVEALCSGTTRSRISRSNLGATKIPLPPLDEQKRIVEVLDAAFEGLSRARAHTESNLQNARELFDAAVSAIFDLEIETGEVAALENVTDLITKGSSPKWQGISYVQEPGVLFVTSENVGTNEILLEAPKYVEDAFNLKDRKSILQNGDVLTNIVGASIGRTAVFERDDVANINQAVCMMRCKQGLLLNHFLAYLLNSPFFKRQLHAAEVDNARANLSLTFFRELQIPLPSVERQAEIVDEIHGLIAVCRELQSHYRAKLVDLDALRQALLQKAFAGELT
jgi:type I restriction enzyme S subunit